MSMHSGHRPSNYMYCIVWILLSMAARGSWSAETPIELPAADGSLKKPLEATPGSKGAVLIFYLHDCPICNAYAPEIERIRIEYEPKGFSFYIVQTDAALNAAAAQKHAKEYGFKCPVLLDGANRLAEKCRATVTPSAAVVGPGEKVLYLGRIDDLYADYGKRRTEATTRDLRLALDAIAAGKPAPPAAGAAVGCFISSNKPDKPQK